MESSFLYFLYILDKPLAKANYLLAGAAAYFLRLFYHQFSGKSKKSAVGGCIMIKDEENCRSKLFVKLVKMRIEKLEFFLYNIKI